MSPELVCTVPFTPQRAFDIGRATDRLAEDGHTAGTIVGHDKRSLDDLIPGVQGYDEQASAVLWTTDFRPSRLVFEAGCLRVYGTRVHGGKLRAVAVPRHFATDAVCIEAYED